MDPDAKVIIIFCDNVRRVLSRLDFIKVISSLLSIIFQLLFLIYDVKSLEKLNLNPFKISAHKRNSKSQTWCDRKYFWSISSSFEPIYWWNEKCPGWYSNYSELRRKIFGNFISKNVTRWTTFSNSRRESSGMDFKCWILFGLSQGKFQLKHASMRNSRSNDGKSATSFD